MNCHRFIGLATSCILAASATAVLAQVPVPHNATVYASGLNGPRGLAFGPDGALYVAEAGTGGKLSTVGVCTQVSAPIGPYKGGTTARILKVVDGKVSVLATGLPSTVDTMGDMIGVADVTFLNGQLYALIAGGGCSHGNPVLPNGLVQVDLKRGSWAYIDDLSLALAEHPPAYNTYNDFEPDGVPMSLATEQGALFVAEPNHAQIFRVAPDGATHLAYDYSFHFADVTPTGIAFREGNLYIGNFGIFPSRAHTERITTLSRNISFFDTTPGLETKPSDVGKLRLATSRAGFTTIMSVKFGPDGLLYALEFSDNTGYPTPGLGKVVRVSREGEIEEVVTGLTVPTGLAFGPDRAMYIANAGAAGPGAGEILRVSNY